VLFLPCLAAPSKSGAGLPVEGSSPLPSALLTRKLARAFDDGVSEAPASADVSRQRNRGNNGIANE